MATYEFYLNAYRGVSLSEEDWPLYEGPASAQLAKYKRMYVVDAPDDSAEDMAVCAMADTLAYMDAARHGDGGPVASASIGSVSVSYANGQGVDISAAGETRQLYRAASLYLDIYRGVPSC